MRDFVFRSEWAKAAEGLSEQVRAEFYAAVIRYGTTGKTSTLKAQAAIAFSFARAQIDADEERRAEISRKRSEAGAKHRGNQYDKPEPKPKEPKEPKKEVPQTKFNVWLKNHCPYIYANLKLPTEEQVEKLKAMYDAQLIADICMQIENRKDKRKTYANLYLTLRNWLKREQPQARKYEVADEQFISDYPPELQQGIESKMRDAILGEHPTLKDTDKGTAQVWLIYQLQDLIETCGVRCEQKQLEQLADVMATNWGTCKVTEFMLFFYRLKSGRYGRFYGHFDPLQVTTSFQSFLRERNEYESKNL